MRWSAITYVDRGNAEVAQGNYQSAIEDYNRAVAIYPKYSSAYDNRGNAKGLLGALNPKDEVAYVNRGTVKAALGDAEFGEINIRGGRFLITNDQVDDPEGNIQKLF